jgi:U2-associated protein SR140
MNKGFNVFGKKLAGTKKEAEEMRKKEDEAAAAVAFEEYVATFQDSGSSRAAGKVWVKAGTYDAGRRRENF